MAASASSEDTGKQPEVAAKCSFKDYIMILQYADCYD